MHHAQRVTKIGNGEKRIYQSCKDILASSHMHMYMLQPYQSPKKTIILFEAITSIPDRDEGPQTSKHSRAQRYYSPQSFMLELLNQ